MPEYLSPGVFVEELDSGPRPIAGVSTSTAGAVGVTEMGPTSGKPVLVTSFGDFTRRFGGFLTEPADPAQVNAWAGNAAEGGRWWQFAHAVQGFFVNGGQRLYVKRVFSSASTAASGAFGRGLVAALAADARAGADRVRLEHLLDVEEGSSLDLVRGDTGSTVGTFTVQGYDAATGGVDLDAPLPEDLREGRDFAEIHTRATAAPDTTVSAAAAARGACGNRLAVRIRPIVGATLAVLPDPGAGPLVATTLAAATTAADTVLTVAEVPGLTATTPAGFTVRVGRRRLAVTAVAAGGAANQVALTIATAAGTVWPVGTPVQVARIANLAGPLRTTTAAAVAAAAATTLTVAEVAGSFDTTVPVAPFRIAVGAREAEVTTVAAGATAGELDLTLAAALGAPVAVGDTVSVVRGPAARQLYVGTAGRLYPDAVVELDNGVEKETTRVAVVEGALVTFADDLAADYLDGHVLRLVEAEVEVRNGPPGEPPAERFTGLRLARDGSPSSLVGHVNARSRLVRLAEGVGYSEDLAGFPTAVTGGWLPLTGGDDSLGTLAPEDFVGVDGGSGNRTGVAALEDIDEISICLAPGIWSRTVRDALITHCETLQDRFAVVDVQDGLGIEEVRERRAVLDSSYAALYYPWLLVRDPVLRVDVPAAPSGHVAGVYARVDGDQGVHKAPANETLRGITGLQQDVTRREQDMLNPLGINALRAFANRGTRVWGARTLSSDPIWRYVNVRRLFLFLEESISEGLEFAVFQPNTPPLWADVTQSITTFLESVRATGAFQGRTKEDAYYVLCDESTMTPGDIDNGLLICEIGVAAARPAEFVVLRFRQKTRDLQPA